METRANYLMVGFFVLLLAFGLLGFVVWLAKFQVDQEFARYIIQYERDVSGIKQGSPVRYQGVRVGEVIDIRLHPKKIGSVLMTIEIDRNTPVRSDTLATLEFEGITGGKSLLLSGGDPDGQALQEDPELGLPVIKAGTSSIQQVLEGAPEVLANINELLLRGNDLLNGENRANIANFLANLNELSGAFAGKGAEIEEIIANASATLANLNTISTSFAKRGEELEQIIANASTVVGNLATVSDTLVARKGEIDQIIVNAATIVKDVSDLSGSLAARQEEIDQIISGASQTVANLTDVTATVADRREDIDRILTNAATTSENFSSLSGNLAVRGEEIEGIIGDASQTMSNFTELTDLLTARRDEIDSVIVNTSATMDNLSDATGSIKDLAGSLKNDSALLVERLDETLLSFDSMAGTIEGSVSGVAGDAQVLIQDLRKTAGSMSGATGEIQAMVAENRESIRDFTGTGLYELTNLLAEARDLISEVNRLSTEVQRDPARFLFGDQQQGYETRR